MIRWFAAGLLVISSVTMAAPSFSPAHEKMLKYFEAHPQDGIQKALWLRHNVLVLSVDTRQHDAEALAKAACKRLLESGFAGMQVSVDVIEHRVLLRANRFEEAEHLACE
ncbi:MULTISPECIES: hypothetical protein [Spongiibacter]|uniref:hypothetical protein n=1 Tax=Spongiibacter TaxID=630749 RepID=UPI000C5D63C8|nr:MULTISPECIES: hypothetical protein [Spongiibacter]MAY39584.1 hypothetical protein [Spongiibacter sp.]MBI59318.1 hypothetical protein [Spongiibacter sp.]|tara:strand:- start:2486 stop:2815 length:330 start_codon:yes stop_codon:yes gene_type:complete